MGKFKFVLFVVITFYSCSTNKTQMMIQSINSKRNVGSDSLVLFINSQNDTIASIALPNSHDLIDSSAGVTIYHTVKSKVVLANDLVFGFTEDKLTSFVNTSDSLSIISASVQLFMYNAIGEVIWEDTLDISETKKVYWWGPTVKLAIAKDGTSIAYWSDHSYPHQIPFLKILDRKGEELHSFANIDPTEDYRYREGRYSESVNYFYAELSRGASDSKILGYLIIHIPTGNKWLFHEYLISEYSDNGKIVYIDSSDGKWKSIGVSEIPPF